MVVDITSISFLANFFVCLIIRPFLMKNFGIKFHRASLSIILQILIFAFNTFAIFIPVGCSVSFFLFFFFFFIKYYSKAVCVGKNERRKTFFGDSLMMINNGVR